MKELIKLDIKLRNTPQHDLGGELLLLGYERYKDYIITTAEYPGPRFVDYLRIINDAMLRDSRVKELLIEYLI